MAKALSRREADPAGAITAARTLLESVCKHLLEDAFKRILGSAASIVEGLGTLRNKVGDTHAGGRKPVKVAPRHADLAVNMTGSMALFLIETAKGVG